MDFGSLLHTAQKNEKGHKKESVRCYNTKFEPPRKEQRNKQLSDNIKKFLAKKEAEEKEQRLEALKKREKLLALRAQDKKATRRMNVMLKRTKSANQSVLQDAVDNDNTSVTLAGPMQPDEDDYGYVSQEAAAYYNKMMEKYSKTPDKPKFNLNGKRKVSIDLSTTRERVRAALEKEKEEANLPHKRKRKHRDDEPEVSFSPPVAAKSKPRPPPPALNFNDLLKLAEKKQFEPIVIEQKPKEEERLLTKKQKKEQERVKEWKGRKEGVLPPLQNRIPKLNSEKNKPPSEIKIPKINSNNEKKVVPLAKKPVEKKVDLKPAKVVPMLKKPAAVTDKPRQFPPKDVKTKKPESSMANLKRKEMPPGKEIKRRPLNHHKMRILDDEDEDSEMDDFIDDGPEESADYSKYISEIFGYDKSKYRNAEDDIDNMESTFAQQMREEVISTKIGRMEDLEDMKLEEEEKRKKALLKKKRK